MDRVWAGGSSREVYADFNALTLRIVTDALFGFQTSSPDSRAVTGKPKAQTLEETKRTSNAIDSSTCSLPDNASLRTSFTVQIVVVKDLYWCHGKHAGDSLGNEATADILSSELAGDDLSAEAVRVAMDYFAGRAATGFAIPEWLPTPDNVQYNRAVGQLDDIVYSIIRQRRATGGAGEGRQVLFHQHSLC